MSDEQLLEASCEATQSTLAEVAAARAVRETAWVRKRKGENIDSSEWNPKKRHRFDAFKWLAQTDWQLLQHTGLGFGHFALTAEQRKQKPWHQWPLLNYAGDQGSKEQCGLWVLKRKLQLNMDEVPDQGHGVWDDCKLGLKAIPDLWSHTLLMLLAWNVRHGPWQEDIRFAQVLGNVRNQAKHGKEARQLPLFMSLIDRMVFDQQDPSLVFVDDVPQELLRRFFESNPFSHKGTKTNLNRFMATIKKAKETASDWTFTSYALTSACLELGMLQGNKFLQVGWSESDVEQSEWGG